MHLWLHGSQVRISAWPHTCNFLGDASWNTFCSHSPPFADWYIMQYFLQSFSPFCWLIHHAILSTVILPLSLIDTSCNTFYSHSPPFADWYIMQYLLVILPLSLIDTSCNTFYSHSPPFTDWYIMQYFLQSFSPFCWLIHHEMLSTVILPLSLIDTSCNTFYSHSLPSSDSRRAAISYWRKYMHQVLVDCLED